MEEKDMNTYMISEIESREDFILKMHIISLLCWYKIIEKTGNIEEIRDTEEGVSPVAQWA